jgi:glycosidase
MTEPSPEAQPPRSFFDARRTDRTSIALLLLLLAGGGRAAAQAPEVVKVEPPNWFIGHSLNPVRLLVRGSHLSGARVAAGAEGVRPGLVRVNDRGTYLFVDVEIDPSAAPGPKPLRISTPHGETLVPFEIMTPLPRAGRFQGFSEDDVIYLAMPDRFANGDTANDDADRSRGLHDRAKARYYHGGDLQGVLGKLPYLRDLGVTALWLNPLYDNNDRLNTKEKYDGQPITDYHGYGAVDFYAVDEHFGDMKGFRELVDAAHAMGIKMIQDQVANHTGPFHPWVKDTPTPTWFHGTEAIHPANSFQTHLLVDPRTPPSLARDTLDGWFIDILPDLNQSDEEVARYLIQNSLWWVGMSGLDAIRQDTLPYVPRSFWRDWMAALKREYPNLRVVGEVLDASTAFVSFFQTGRAQFDGVDSGIDTLFDYPLYYGLRRAFAQGQSIREAVNVLHDDYVYPAASRLVTLLGSHDVPRFMNEPGATHDGLKLAATFLLTTRGTPQWYYGDEIGMSGGSDPDNRRDFPGGWSSDPTNAFDASGRSGQEQSVFAYVRSIMHLRRNLDPLRRGRMVHLAITEQGYVFARILGSATVLVALNNGTAPATLSVDVGATPLDDGATLVDRLGGAAEVRVAGGRIDVSLRPRSSAIYVAR